MNVSDLIGKAIAATGLSDLGDPAVFDGLNVLVTASSEKRDALFSMYQSSKAGLERFTEALHAELLPDGIRTTIVRAGGMADADSKSPASGEVARRFAEENIKRGLDMRQRPVSSFTSTADVVSVLLNLPGDVNIP